MSGRRLLPLLSICALIATGALFVSGATATSVGDGVTLCAKGASVSYPATGTCKSNETPLVLTANGDSKTLDDDVGDLQTEVSVLRGQVDDLEARVAALEAAAGS